MWVLTFKSDSTTLSVAGKRCLVRSCLGTRWHKESVRTLSICEAILSFERLEAVNLRRVRRCKHMVLR